MKASFGQEELKAQIDLLLSLAKRLEVVSKELKKLDVEAMPIDCESYRTQGNRNLRKWVTEAEASLLRERMNYGL